MTQTIETNLADFLNKLDQKIDKLRDEIGEIKDNVNDVKVSLAKLDEGQNGLNKRLDNLEFIIRAVIAGVIVSLVISLTKFLFPHLIA